MSNKCKPEDYQGKSYRLRYDGLQVGDPVSESPVGDGCVTGITDAGYPQVNHIAVVWLKRPDGAVFDPIGKHGGHQVGEIQQAIPA